MRNKPPAENLESSLGEYVTAYAASHPRKLADDTLDDVVRGLSELLALDSTVHALDGLDYNDVVPKLLKAYVKGEINLAIPEREKYTISELLQPMTQEEMVAWRKKPPQEDTRLPPLLKVLEIVSPGIKPVASVKSLPRENKLQKLTRLEDHDDGSWRDR